MVVGFAPGGGTDLVARIIGQKMTERWGQPVIVDNRAGATGTIGADIVANPRPTATRCSWARNPHGITPNLFKKLPYDTERDFPMVGVRRLRPDVLVIHRRSPRRT